ncbi:MAG: hypothetical protein AB1830_06045 [Pseudomonadota bacterium]
MTATTLGHARGMRGAPVTSGRQRGQVLLLMLLVLITGAAYLLVQSLNAGSIATERDRITQQALAQAKEALIGRALVDNNRPGSLPCPDLDDDGSAEILSGNECPSYIGRLPWRTLRLPDLRDGSGERLWYSLSRNFRDDDSIVINSYSPGDLSIVGTSPQSDVVAVVFAPGTPLQREDASTIQTRGCIVGTDCDDAGICTASPASSTPKCNSKNYLDVVNAVEDNADGDAIFVAAHPSASFNDRLLAIGHDELFVAANKRIAGEIRGTATPASGVQGYYEQQSPKHYPWASNGTGYQIPGEKTGSVPYEELPFDPTIKEVLKDNGWFDPSITVYTVAPDRSSATITIQNPAVSVCLENGNVVQCP